MTLFSLIFFRLLPLYGCIALGLIAGRRLRVESHTVAALVFYILLPLVIFNGVMHVSLSPGVLLLPALLFCMSSLLCLTMYWLAGYRWQNASRNILALSAGNGNMGYFGLPVAMLIFDEKTVGIYIMALLGVTIYENSVGYFITARGHHTVKESLVKICRLPSFYAFLLGLALNVAGLKMPTMFDEFFNNARGAYSILGMMMIGLGLSTVGKLKVDLPFIAAAFISKFVAFPLLALGVIALDKSLLHLFSIPIHQAIFLISIVPMGANSVVIATLLKAEPEKIAFTVLLSTIIALFTVPMMASWFFS